MDESDDSLDEVVVEPKSYKGPHLNFPLTKPDLDMLINLFRKRKVSSSFFLFSHLGILIVLIYFFRLFLVQASCEICGWNIERGF